MAHEPRNPRSPHDPSRTGQAREMASQAGRPAQDMLHRAGDAAADLGHRAGDTMAAVGDQMRSLAGTIRERVPHEGMLGSAADAVARGLESGGSYLREQHLDDMCEDLAAVIRRYPIQSLLAGMGVGFLLASTLRRNHHGN